jgi:hypothetical protein
VACFICFSEPVRRVNTAGIHIYSLATSTSNIDRSSTSGGGLSDSSGSLPALVQPLGVDRYDEILPDTVGRRRTVIKTVSLPVSSSSSAASISNGILVGTSAPFVDSISGRLPVGRSFGADRHARANKRPVKRPRVSRTSLVSSFNMAAADCSGIVAVASATGDSTASGKYGNGSDGECSSPRAVALEKETPATETKSREINNNKHAAVTEDERSSTSSTVSGSTSSVSSCLKQKFARGKTDNRTIVYSTVADDVASFWYGIRCAYGR